MKYENIISNVKEFSYCLFREFYGHVKYGLQMNGAMAEDEGDLHSVEVYRELNERAYEHGRYYLSYVHLEDDEYGTLAYTGYSRTYRDACVGFLESMERLMQCQIDFVIYDGEINCVTFRGFDPDGYITFSERHPF